MKTALKVLLVITNLTVITAVLLYMKKKRDEEAIITVPAEQSDGNDAYFSMNDMDSFFGAGENNE